MPKSPTSAVLIIIAGKVPPLQLKSHLAFSQASLLNMTLKEAGCQVYWPVSC